LHPGQLQRVQHFDDDTERRLLVCFQNERALARRRQIFDCRLQLIDPDGFPVELERVLGIDADDGVLDLGRLRA
jgi:hypothetical protein